MQVADTEQEIDAPDQTPGPVEGLPAGAVATKSQSFPLPSNAMVRQLSRALLTSHERPLAGPAGTIRHSSEWPCCDVAESELGSVPARASLANIWQPQTRHEKRL